MLTSNRKLRTASYELKVCSPRRHVILRHDINKVADRATFDVEAVVCLERLAKS